MGNRSGFTGFQGAILISCVFHDTDTDGNVYRSSAKRVVSGFGEKGIVGAVDRGSPDTGSGFAWR